MSEIYNFNSEQFEFVLAQDEDRSNLVELAISSNDTYKTRSVPITVARDVLALSNDQINAGLVEKLIDKNSSTVLGFYALRASPAEILKNRIELHSLFVDPRYFHHGLGTILFERAKVKARNMGMKIMYVCSDPDAFSFYLKYGATITGNRENLLNPKAPLVLLDYELGRG